MSNPNSSRSGPRNIADVLECSVGNYAASDIFSERSVDVGSPSITPPRPVAQSPLDDIGASRPANLRAAPDPILPAPPHLPDLPPGLSLSDARYADMQSSTSVTPTDRAASSTWHTS
jgi:hypothetical protein